MEQEAHQWVVHPHEEEGEEGMMEDGALIRKKFVSHSKGSLVTEEVTSFSSSSCSNSSSSGDDSEHGDGICSVVTAPDGSPVQKDEEASEIGNGGENCNHVNGHKSDYEAVGLAQVAEFAGEPTNVEATSGVTVSQNMNSVYFDKQQGMWKCHHCTWTKRFDCPWAVPNWNLKGYPDLMMSVQSMIQHGPCFVCEIKDEGVNGLNGVLNGDASGSVHPTNLEEKEFDAQADLSVIQNSLCSENTSQYMKTADDMLPSFPELSHIYNSSGIQATAVTGFHEETSAEEAPNLIKEGTDQLLEEFDVETVLEKQETHDLFCPNCHAHITKRVIIKKRKRNGKILDTKAKRDKSENIHNLDHKAEPDKLEIIGSPGLLDSPEHPSANQGDIANVRSEPDIVSEEPPADDNQPHDESEVFCLSCLRFFIPSGNCFEVFRGFGGASRKEGARNSPSVPANNLQFPSNSQGSSSNWFKSLIKKGEKASDAPLEYTGTGSAQQHSSASPGIGLPKDPPADTSVVTDVKPTPAINHSHGGMDPLISSTNGFSAIQSGTKGVGDLVNGVQRVVQDTTDFSDVKQSLDGNLISEVEKKSASEDITREGNCFEVFRGFGGASRKEGAQNSPSVPANNLQFPSNSQGSSSNWFKSLIKKGENASNAPLEYTGTGSVQQHNSASPGIGLPKDPPADTSVVTDVKPTSDTNHSHGGMDPLISSTNGLSSIQSGTKSVGDLVNGVQRVVQDTTDFSDVKQSLDGNLISEVEKKSASEDITREAATTKDAILKPYEGKPKFLTSTTVGSQVLKGTPKDVDKTPGIIQNGYSSLVQGAQSPFQSSGIAILANDVASSKQNSTIDAIFPSKLDFTLIGNVQQDIDKEIFPPTRKENEGGEVIVDLGEGVFVSTPSPTADDIPDESAIITESPTLIETEQPRVEVGEPQGWEILKSIVYGGLVESITSLGIVSSAISSGATPLNIIALGFANIIGGLFILGHNLVDLKNDHFGEDGTQTVVQDRYHKFLGRRENFLLHAVVAVLSFLIFGAVPLVVYGLLNNKNYYTELKLAMVAAASVVCIILLAIGKVYTSRPPKAYMKTVLYYVTLALATSGVTYVAGNLIKDLLEKLNHPESGFAIAMPISDTKTGSTWMSQ